MVIIYLPSELWSVSKRWSEIDFKNPKRNQLFLSRESTMQKEIKLVIKNTNW